MNRTRNYQHMTEYKQAQENWRLYTCRAHMGVVKKMEGEVCSPVKIILVGFGSDEGRGGKERRRA